MENYDTGEHLLDFLARVSGNLYLSDLHYLNAAGDKQLERIIQAIPAQSATLEEWNEVLCYLTGSKPEQTAAQARNRLLQWLHQQENRM